MRAPQPDVTLFFCVSPAGPQNTAGQIIQHDLKQTACHAMRDACGSWHTWCAPSVRSSGTLGASQRLLPTTICLPMHVPAHARAPAALGQRLSMWDSAVGELEDSVVRMGRTLRAVSSLILTNSSSAALDAAASNRLRERAAALEGLLAAEQASKAALASVRAWHELCKTLPGCVFGTYCA